MYRQLRITRGLFETLGEGIFKFYGVPGRHYAPKAPPCRPGGGPAKLPSHGRSGL